MLISPYKNRLNNLLVPPPVRESLFSRSAGLPSIRLSARQTHDLEMLATGGFSPLDRFLGEADFLRVLEDMRLADGTVFPIPVTLGVDDLDRLRLGEDVALRDPHNHLIAVMNVGEIYEWDREHFAEAVCGTCDPRHPLVAELAGWGRFNLSGELKVLDLPKHKDFRELRMTPAETRSCLESLGRSNVVAFQTRNPIHRGHEEMTKRAMEMTDGSLLVHPPVGMTKEGDIDHVTRVRTYKAVVTTQYPANRVLLSLLPLAMRLAGPREAVWHAIVRRNYGADHFIVGRDHASPGNDSSGKPFYAPCAAQELALKLGPEIGVKILPFKEFAFFPSEDRYEEVGPSRARKVYLSLSGTRVREEFLDRGKRVPEWLMRKEAAEILEDSYPPRQRQGVCLWFTGLSGAGKSTTAEIVADLLIEEGRRVTLLDGDIVRMHLSKGLGYSKQDRDTNVLRMAFVASEVVRHGGIAICAAVSPYRDSRSQVRQMFGEGHFIEVFVDAPIEVCEERDVKGLYASARRGEIRDFTGIDDVYEVPVSPEIRLDTVAEEAWANARRVVDHLQSEGYLLGRGDRHFPRSPRFTAHGKGFVSLRPEAVR